MDSDFSAAASDGSEVPYRPGVDEQEDDDEEYVEISVSQRRPKVRGTKRTKSSGSNGMKTMATRKRSKEQGEDDFEEDDLTQLSSPKRRHTQREIADEEEEKEGTPVLKITNQDMELQMELPTDQLELEDEIIPSAVVPDDEEEIRETTEDSMKSGNRSKMLTELLGDGNVRKSLNEEEVQLRRAENARKRKNLSEKRLEEEKQETINKLLRRRAGKSRSHLPNDDDRADPQSDMTNFSKPRRPYVTRGMNRTLRRRDGDIYCMVEKT